MFPPTSPDNAALAVACPKCGAAPGEGCWRLDKTGPMRSQWFVVHKKRMLARYRAEQNGAPSTDLAAFPFVRPASPLEGMSSASRGAQVGAVDSALSGLDRPSYSWQSFEQRLITRLGGKEIDRDLPGSPGWARGGHVTIDRYAGGGRWLRQSWRL